MQTFQHKHAREYTVEFDSAPGGGFVARRMVVVSRIPIDRTEPDFNPMHAADLEIAATVFARSKGIATVTLTRKFEVGEVVQLPGFAGIQVEQMPGFIRIDLAPAQR